MKPILTLFLLFFTNIVIAQHDTSSVKILNPILSTSEESTTFQKITTAFTWLVGVGSLITLIFLNRNLRIAKEQLIAQQNSAKENLENQKTILKLSTNTNIINGLHLMLMENPSFLKFHDTTEEDIKDCGLEVKQFVYILNSILASEFYYDSFSSADSILEDLGHYRMKFLDRPEVEKAWNKIIRKHWTMAPFFVQAVDKFYSNREAYIHKDQGTAI